MQLVGSSRAGGPQIDRIRKFIEQKDHVGEKSIAMAQVIISSFLFALHFIAGIKNGWEPVNSSVILCLVVINSFSLVRYLATRRRQISSHYFNFLTILDRLTFLILIMSCSPAYHMPFVSNLQTTRMVFLFVFIGLRTLKSDPLQVFVAGGTIIFGWTSHLLLVLLLSPDLQITKSFSE